MRKGEDCSECGIGLRCPEGSLEVRLEIKKGVKWGDILGCGSYPLFIVSERVLKDWRTEDIGEMPAFPVHILPPLPKRLQDTHPPAYFWLDGVDMLGARMDFDASGYVFKGTCSACGRRLPDVRATYQRRSARACADVLVEGSWNGAPLFTTDLSPTAFYCTRTILECARKYRHSNFRFTPIEAGEASWSKGIDYLGKKWPVHHPLRQSEGKSLEEWLALLRDPSQRWEARCAILDLADEAATAVPVLLDILRESGDVPLRREVELVLSGLGKRGIALGPEGEEAARRHEEWFQSTLGRKET